MYVQIVPYPNQNSAACSNSFDEGRFGWKNYPSSMPAMRVVVLTTTHKMMMKQL